MKQSEEKWKIECVLKVTLYLTKLMAGCKEFSDDPRVSSLRIPFR